jgi:threonine/homoserine/homoserine lactone efflux protein
VSALAVGFAAGFVVSMQLGPLSLFLIRSTLRGTLAIGLAIGAGIAVLDALYAAAGAAGAAPVLSIESVRTLLGLVGAAVLVALGARTAWGAFPALGSMAWVTILAVAVAAARARVGPRLLALLDASAGTAIVGFGGVLAWRTLREGS